jgi:hypothetical protein
MTMTRRETLVAASAVPLVLAAAAPTKAQTSPATSGSAPAPVSADEAKSIALEAYYFLYPLLSMELTRLQLINRPRGGAFGGAPSNVFLHARAFPTADMRAVVRPNFDTLYSSAWLDITAEPVILSVPDAAGRYYQMPLLDMWTDVFAVPGRRSTGTDAGHFAIVPSGWSGTLPARVQRIDAPTPHIWVIGRTQTNGPADYAAVHRIQDGFTLTLLSDWGKTPRAIEQKIDAAVDVKTEPARLVNAMSAEDYFRRGAELMRIHKPHHSDWSVVARMRRIGIEPGRFDSSRLDAAMLRQLPGEAQTLMRAGMATMAPIVNGWSTTRDGGVFGNAYFKRAVLALAGLGMNPPEEAIYPASVRDADGRPLMANNRYTLRFEKAEVPPVDAFWSLTLYDEEGFQVANPLNRFAIGDRDKLTFGSDGSLEIYVQHERPAPDREANWLPSPAAGQISLVLRLYAPRPEALNGMWNPPAIRRSA